MKENHERTLLYLVSSGGGSGFMFKADLPRFPDFKDFVLCEFTMCAVTSVCLPVVFTWGEFLDRNPLAYEKEGSRIEFG